ncbi:MAG: hypothetical protein VKL59_22555 [Nostocaceae cyanobacterium]|nr:hypothetical protein [Nostocaceae cyanobacterium]
MGHAGMGHGAWGMGHGARGHGLINYTLTLAIGDLAITHDPFPKQ